MKELYATEIAPVVNARWQEEKGVDGEGSAPPWFRARVARDLFNGLHESRQSAIKARAQAAAQMEREEHAERVRQWPDRSPEGVQRRVLQWRRWLACADSVSGPSITYPPSCSVLCRDWRTRQDCSSSCWRAGPSRDMVVKSGLYSAYPSLFFHWLGAYFRCSMSVGRNHAAAPTSFPNWKRVEFDKDILGLYKEYLHTAYSASRAILYLSWTLLTENACSRSRMRCCRDARGRQIEPRLRGVTGDGAGRHCVLLL